MIDEHPDEQPRLRIKVLLPNHEQPQILDVASLITPGVWDPSVPALGKVLADYEAVLLECSSTQEMADRTLNFIKKTLGSKCGCLRTAKNGKELRFRSSDCEFITGEHRVFKLEHTAIITTAANNGACILVDDQTHNRNNPNNFDSPNPNKDTGSLITVSLMKEERVRYPERFQATCCMFKEVGYFNLSQIVLVNMIIRRLEDAYRAAQYLDVAPFLSKVAGTYRNALASSRNLGPSAAEIALENFLSDSLELPPRIAHNFAWFIKEDPRTFESHPTLIHTLGGLGTQGRGLRKYQKAILTEISIGNEEGVAAVTAEVLHLQCGSSPKKKIAQSPKDWDASLSVAVIPIKLDQDRLGFLWLERYSQPAFSLEEVARVSKRLVSGTQDKVIQAVASPARPRRAFVALTSNPPMALVRQQVAMAARSRRDPVLIFGESGTGKELVARFIHAEGGGERYWPIPLNEIDRPDFHGLLFGRMDATGLHDGYIHQHDTIVFDQLEKYPAVALHPLLRLLDEGSFTRVGSTQVETAEVRFIGIVTTDIDIEGDLPLSAELRGRFKTRIYMPPLGRRISEIETIVSHWLASGELSEKFPGRSLAPEVVEELKKYRWGKENLRELMRVIEKACLAAGDDSWITLHHLHTVLSKKTL